MLDLNGVSVPAGTYAEQELSSSDGSEGTRADRDSSETGQLPFAVTLLGGSRTDAEVLEIARRLEEAVRKRDGEH